MQTASHFGDMSLTLPGFAVAAIRRWLERMGCERYPKAKELTITADCGGSNVF